MNKEGIYDTPKTKKKKKNPITIFFCLNIDDYLF